MADSSNKKLELRDYQKECLAAIDKMGAGRGVVQLPTGSGKTATFTHIPLDPDERVLVLSHRKELVHQPIKYYTEQGIDVGIEQAEEHSHGEQVVSASVQSMHGRLDEFDPDDFDTIITDECHHAAAHSYCDIYDYFNGMSRHIGFSATPNRQNRKTARDREEERKAKENGHEWHLTTLADVFPQGVIFERDIAQMIKAGWLCDAKCRVGVLEEPWDLSTVAKVGDDYSEHDLAVVVDNEKYNMQVAEAYLEYRRGPTLVFAVDRSHAQHLAEKIPNSAVLLGNTPKDERAQILRDFEDGIIDCIVNCEVLTEGIDLPMVETVLLARPTCSPVRYVQMVGRGLRPYPNKDYCLLLDCGGLSDKHDLCTPADLVGVNANGFNDEICNGFLSELCNRAEDKSDNPLAWLSSMSEMHSLIGKVYWCNWCWRLDGSAKTGSYNGARAEMTAPDKIGRTVLHVYYDDELVYEDTFQTDEAADKKAYKELKDLMNVVPDNKRNNALWDAQITKKWANDPATEKQIAHINRLCSQLGYEPPSGMAISKGDAHIIIELLQDKRNKLLGQGA